METASNSESMCLICYKSFVNPASCNVNKAIGTCLKLLFRQLGLNAEVGLDEIKTCEKCSSLLVNYGDIHHNCKLLELQLQLRISDISNVIRSAGRIPKRVQAFKAWCDQQDNNGQLGRSGSHWKELRSNLKAECMNQMKSFPRLKLDRVDQKMSENTQSWDQKALFLGWLTSCIAIGALSDFNCQNMDHKQPEEIPVDGIVQATILIQAEKNPVTTGSAYKQRRKQCHICKSFFAASSFRRHMNRLHRDLTNCHQCLGCKRWFSDKRSMQIHAFSCKSIPLQVSDNVGVKVPTNCQAAYNSAQLVSPHDFNKNMGTGAVKAVMSTLQRDSATSNPCSTKKSKRNDRAACCNSCGRRFRDNWALRRHTKTKACHFTATEARMKLNATLEFICQFCNRNMKERFNLERHVASCHRLLHVNAWEYQHLDIGKGEAAGIYFCPFCGLKEASRKSMTTHFRANHKDLFGVPKISINKGKLDDVLFKSECVAEV